MNALEKIKKLLALSSSGNENEAALALEAAMKLAVKYRIDIEDVKGTEFSGECGYGTESEYKFRREQWEYELYNGIAKIFGCRAIFRGRFDLRSRSMSRAAVIVGTPEDRAIVEYLVTYLQREVKKLLKKHNENPVPLPSALPNWIAKPIIARHKITTRRQRNAFYLGAVWRVTETAKAKFQDSATETEKQEYGLVLKRGAAAENFVAGIHVKKSSANAPDQAAIRQGYRAGADISVNRAINSKDRGQIGRN